MLCLNLSDYRVSVFPPNQPTTKTYQRACPLLLKNLFGNAPDLYLSFTSASIKEDWYIVLRLAIDRVLRSNVDNMINNQQLSLQLYMESIIHQVESKSPVVNVATEVKPLPAISSGDPSTQWFNVLLGRTFYSISTTAWLNDLIEMKLKKKLESMKRPAMLGPMTLRSFDIGNNSPMIYNANVLRISTEGDVEVSLDLSYQGGFALEIETEANLEAGITNIALPVTLRVVVNQLSGKVTIAYWILLHQLFLLICFFIIILILIEIIPY